MQIISNKHPQPTSLELGESASQIMDCVVSISCLAAFGSTPLAGTRKKPPT